MDILQELEDFIHEFNSKNDVDFAIDSIRVEFSKQYKLKKRLIHDEITTAYQLEKHNIYYYNMQDKPKYRKAIMVIFGLKQYHAEPPPRTLVQKILNILKDVSNIDVCLDVPYQPNLDKLKKNYILDQYTTPNGVKTDTHYINNPHLMGIEKVTIYNKGFKNSLNRILWRFEAKMLIHNIKALYLPLDEFKDLIEKGA